VARFAKRTRARFRITTQVGRDPKVHTLYTRDISATGLFVETDLYLPVRFRLPLTLFDEDTGGAVTLDGEITRVVEATESQGGGLGIRLLSSPASWLAVVRRIESRASEGRNSNRFRTLRRLSVLVVGTEPRRRTAVALYVQSGWNVRFASTVQEAEEAVKGLHTDAVIIEEELSETDRNYVLGLARKELPTARRIVRSRTVPPLEPGVAPAEALVQHFVDAQTGLEGVLEALMALEGPPHKQSP
jgi:hypothetical protein